MIGLARSMAATLLARERETNAHATHHAQAGPRYSPCGRTAGDLLYPRGLTPPLSGKTIMFTQTYRALSFAALVVVYAASGGCVTVTADSPIIIQKLQIVSA